MSLSSLVPVNTAKYILGSLYDASVILPLANPQIKADASIGSRVYVNTIPKLTASDYSGTVTNAEGTSTAYNFYINTKKYASVLLRDEEVGQSILTMDEVVSKFREGAVNSLADAADAYLAAQYSNFKAIGNNSTGVIDVTTGAKAMAAVLSVKKAMDQASIPSNGRWLVVGPSFAANLLSGVTDKMFQNTGILQNGEIGTLYGIKILQSNNIKTDGTADEVLIGGYSESLGFAHNVTTVETLRDADAFGTVVRALYVFGGTSLGSNSADVRGIALFGKTV